MASSTTSNTASDDEKSHTFRKRRLSLSRHHIAPGSDDTHASSPNNQESPASTAAAAAAAAAATPGLGNNDNEAEHVTNRNAKHVEGDAPPLPVVVAPPVQHDDESAAESAASDQKAQTFRKRRLSLTSKKPDLEAAAAAATSSSVEGDNEEQKEEEDAGAATAESSPAPKIAKISQDQHIIARRPRRASDASAASKDSNNTSEGLKVRTLHADEIIAPHDTNRCPPSPALDYTGQNRLNADDGSSSTNNNNANFNNDGEPHVLYRLSRPSSMSLLQAAAEGEGGAKSPQPKWKKRIVRKHDEDERKLPFPRDVVGTYSCHGVEPVYDSDYDHTDEDEEDEDDWTEDISGEKSSSHHNRSITGGIGSVGPGKVFREPKPTTAAKINQDRGGVAFPYGRCARTALFAAYDGHGQGGELVSQFALHEVQSRLEKRPEFNTDLEKAFKDTFLAVDEALRHEPLIEPLYAGTTACVALLRENILTVANAGDSRAVVARRRTIPDGDNVLVSYEAIDLTVDQNPDLPEERLRIESMGGFVSPPPEPGLSARVWLDEGFSQIGLAMARSIGDHAVAQVGVIAEPVVTNHTVLEEDEFMIIATDGVWEFITSEQAVEIVGVNLSRGATKATQALIEAAAARWHDEEGDYRDDITALVVRLSELWKRKPAALASQKAQQS